MELESKLESKCMCCAKVIDEVVNNDDLKMPANERTCYICEDCADSKYKKASGDCIVYPLSIKDKQSMSLLKIAVYGEALPQAIFYVKAESIGIVEAESIEILQTESIGIAQCTKIYLEINKNLNSNKLNEIIIDLSDIIYIATDCNHCIDGILRLFDDIPNHYDFKFEKMTGDSEENKHVIFVEQLKKQR